jgi:sulfur-oxidizing protein SoxA
MKGRVYLTLALASCITVATSIQADPVSDNETVRSYFTDKFPDVALEDLVDGVYAIDKNSRDQWLQMEEFPPYDEAISKGETLFTTPFTNGKDYASCFDNGGIGIKQNYPYFDTDKNQVVTLEQDVNNCRTENGEQPLSYGKGAIAYITSYMASTSKGNLINVTVPNDPAAQAAYEDGKQFFYSRRGQLNMACATCHMASAGQRLRADILSPAIGQVSHFPAFRYKWDDVGTIQRRYAGCNTQIRSKPFKLQSEQYRNLEYFHTYMSNGLPINGPGSRK